MQSLKNPNPTLGVIYGNRDFFPDQLVTEARADMAKVFAKFGIKAIQLGEADSKLGGVETHNDARKCAELFRQHADEIDGVLVCLPNFGDEKGVADTLKLAKLNVPVLIQAYPDDLNQLSPARRRDAFCGKISVTNNLVQAGIKFSLTSKHVSHPSSPSFEVDLQKFLGVCRVVNGVHGVRLGAVGAPAAHQQIGAATHVERPAAQFVRLRLCGRLPWARRSRADCGLLDAIRNVSHCRHDAAVFGDVIKQFEVVNVH